MKNVFTDDPLAATIIEMGRICSQLDLDVDMYRDQRDRYIKEMEEMKQRQENANKHNAENLKLLTDSLERTKAKHAEELKIRDQEKKDLEISLRKSWFVELRLKKELADLKEWEIEQWTRLKTKVELMNRGRKSQSKKTILNFIDGYLNTLSEDVGPMMPSEAERRADAERNVGNYESTIEHGSAHNQSSKSS